MEEMATAGLGMGSMIVIAGLILWFGLLRPVETAAKMLDDEAQVYAAQRKATHVATLAELAIDADSVAKAQDNLKRLNSIKL